MVPDLIVLFHELSVFAKLTIAVSLGTCGLAISFAIRPSERKLLIMRPASLSAIFAAVSALLSGGVQVLIGIAATPDGQLHVPRVYAGIAEVLMIGFVCFGFLSAAWMLAAVGMLRRP
jgi:hypothetical protein